MAFKSKRSGGPKSSVGKAKSSQNALEHGLAISSPTTVIEKDVMQAFISELTDFYKPQSPLEKMQIERIALCRAKLARLYAVENARLEIETNKLAHSPHLFFEKMPHVKGLIKGMAMEFIKFGALTLPFGCSEHEWVAIVDEVRKLQNESVDEARLWKTAPTLVRCVDRHTEGSNRDQSDGDPVPRLIRLECMLQRLEQIEDQGERYMEHVKAIYAVYERLLVKREEDSLDVDNNSGADELLQYIQQQQDALAAEREKRHGKPKTKPINPEEEAQHTQKRVNQVVKKCQLFVSFYFDSQEAKRVYSQYQQTRALLLNAVALPAAEADLMLRYQTTWERRLSTAVGELLELQRRNS